MATFQKILVGIDLTSCQQLSIEALPAMARDVFRCAVWLAQKSGARLTLLSALNLMPEPFELLAETDQLALTETVQTKTNQVLTELVRQANASGVPADSVFTAGKGWLEIIHQVLRGGHDLVLVGTRNFTGVRRMLLGNTALKLFRHCPCPVWVTRPDLCDRPLNLLVTSDLKPVSDTVLRLGVSIGQMLNAKIHVLHVIEYPLYNLAITCLPDEAGSDYERSMRARAEHLIQQQIDQAGFQRLERDVLVHFVDRSPSDQTGEAILQFVAENAIDLLILGSMGRGGAARITIGNTAERLLPEVKCSVLAVKPPDFVCPVQLP
jgi:universal stress protein E